MLELDIDAIHVTVAGGSEDDESREEFAQAVQRHILDAMEELSRSDLATGCANDERLQIDLREIDWESEPDKTGKIARLLREALEGAS